MTQYNSINPIPLITTETRNTHTFNLDLKSAEELVQIINDEQHIPAQAVKAASPQITEAITLIEKGLLNGGRLFYAGAGTSGRLGVLDASECPPTFCTPPELVQGIIAGGDKALREAVESAEDNEDTGYSTFKSLSLTPWDSVVGISCSGRARYVAGALKAAREAGSATIMHSCVDNEVAREFADVRIITNVGPEVITGSTRMKGGTATKMVLNILSTAVMIRLGKVYDNLMVDVKPSNRKLRERAVRMVSQITDLDDSASKLLLEKAHWHVKSAVVMFRRNSSWEEAQNLLEDAQGHLRKVIEP